MILLVVAGLSVSGVVTYSALRSSLLERVDQQLASLQSPAGHLLKDQLGLGGPGPGGPGTSLPEGTYAAYVEGHGHPVAQLIVGRYGEQAPPSPALPTDLPHSGLFDTGTTAASPIPYRVIAQSAQAIDPDLPPYLLVVAVPLTDLQKTLHQLLLTEGLVALGVAVALGLVSWW